MDVKKLEEHKARFRDLAATYIKLYVPEFRRAAEDGRDVSSTAIEAHWKRLRTVLEQFGHRFVTIRGTPEEHPRPRNLAYERLDGIDAIVAELAAPIVAEAQTRIVRVDLCPVQGCASGRRTCIELEVTYGEGTTKELYVYADTAPQHTHEGS